MGISCTDEVNKLAVCRKSLSTASFVQLPMPPSSNHMYKLFRRGRKTFHVPSKELKTFQNEMILYPRVHKLEFLSAKHTVLAWINAGQGLEISCQFFFHYSRLFTKDGRVKKLDVSNRIKALHDCLCRLLGIDDSVFFRVSAEKGTAHADLDEMVMVDIRPIVNKTLQDFTSGSNLEPVSKWDQ